MAKAAAATAERANQYEAMFLYGPGAGSDLEGAIKNCRSIIERHGGAINVIKKWDERKLTYEIGGQKRGTYIIAYYKGPGKSVGEIERDVNLSEDILRVILTKADHLNQEEMEKVEPQPIIPREERAPWDRPSFNDRPDRGDRGFRRDDRRGPREESDASAGKE